MKKGYLKEFWNGFHLEEEDKENFEIRGLEVTSGITKIGINTMNGSTGKNGNEK